jgi:hypothetical protein
MKLTLEQCQELMDENNGNLDLFGRKDITELPDNLTVKGELDIRYSAITKLSKNLTVKGGFIATNTQLESLPINLIIESTIRCNADSPLVNLAFEGYKIEII